MNGKRLIVVGLIMTAVILGAFTVQHCIWMTSTKVTKRTNSPTLKTNSESGAMHNGTEDWGCDPTAHAGPTAAESIYTPDSDRIRLSFRVRGTDVAGIINNFADLSVQVNLYIPEEYLEVQTYNENCLLANIVSDDTTYDVSGTLDNSGNGFEPEITLDAVIHIFENTQAVEAADTVYLPIDIWAEKHS